MPHKCSHYLHRMVADQTQATNEIEQVRSTRKETGRQAIETVTRQPLRFRLAERGVSLLQLDGE